MKLLQALVAVGPALLHTQAYATSAPDPENPVAESQGTVITVPWYGIEHFSISNATIVSRWSGTIMTVIGNNNRIIVGNAGNHGHGRYSIVGNNNFLNTGPSGGNIDIVGTNNTVRAPNAFVTEHSGGNHYVTIARGGIWVWQDNAGGAQGQSFTDTVDLISPLNILGCSAHCDPSTVLTYTHSGRRGLHRLDSTPPIPGANGPIFYFFDCSDRNLDLAGFLANSAILHGPAPETWPANPPRATAGPGWGITMPDDIQIGAFGPMNFTEGASDGNFTFVPGGPWIFDAWAYAHNQTVSATVCVISGLINGAKCAGPDQHFTGPQQVVNETLTAIKYTIPRVATTDTFTMKVTNTGGGSASMTMTMTIRHGGVCP
ncbi:MAG TPA: hypothetical protein VIZ17_00580 [Acetobacteraceae bacterium]